MKYCSERCRHHKPGPLDRRIEHAFTALLDDSGAFEERSLAEWPPLLALKEKRKTVKGDPRVMVDCTTVEELIFGSRHDPTKIFGRRKNRATRVLGGQEDPWKSVDMEDEEEGDLGCGEDDQDISMKSGKVDAPPMKTARDPGSVGPMIRPRQTEAEVNGSIGGEKGWAERQAETAEAATKRKDGQRKSEEREMVRRAARRGCAFGFVVPYAVETGDCVNLQKGKGLKKKQKKQQQRGEESSLGQELASTEQRRKCEAVMHGVVVESSFAKGDWAIRWRE